MKIVKIPFNGGSLGKNIGTEKAPDKIIEKLKENYVNFYVNENKRGVNFEVLNVKLNTSNFDVLQDELMHLEGDIFIGRDHSITYGLVKGLNGEKGLIIFDAHPDCEVPTNSITHEDYLRKLIEDEVIDARNIILIGLRDYTKVELEFLERNKVNCYFMKNLFENDIKEVCDDIMEIANRFGSLYISVDIDAVDCAFAPGTGYPSPCGLTSRELIYFLQRLKLLKNLRRVDLVEINPDKDVNEMTIILGAKIIAELL